MSDSRGPDSPAELDKRSWFYVARKTAREFTKDDGSDKASQDPGAETEGEGAGP